ncbi:MAG: 2OG-Fe(II) oxygenase [Alphaproteobacteria bacterium]
MSAIDLDSFDATPLEKDPYEFLIVPAFIKPEAIPEIDQAYPRIAKAGSFPLEELEFGKAFAAFLSELEGPEMRRAFEKKFGMNLEGRPTMITARGHCQAKDGKIHNDSETKLITVLIYMNTEWAQDGGRLRVLRSSKSLDDYAAEVPPEAGTLLAFKRDDRSFHGHETCVGERRVIQLNWVMDEAVVRREKRRHRFSARVKSLFSAA